MRIIDLQGQPFAIEMVWRDVPHANPHLKEFRAWAVEHGAHPKSPVGVFLPSETGRGGVVGWMPVDAKLSNKKTASLAGSLAKTLKNGIYLSRLPDVDGVWLLIVADGMVNPLSDRVYALHEVESQASMLRALLDLEVYADPSCAHVEALPWSLQSALSEVKHPALLVRLGANTISPILLGGALVLALAMGGYAYFDSFGKPQLRTGPTPEEIEAQNRANYVQSIIAQVNTGRYPLNAAWIEQAMEKVQASAIRMYGWVFEGAECAPGSCTMIYVAEKDMPSVKASLINHLQLQEGQYTVSEDGKTFKAFMAFEHASPLLQWQGEGDLNQVRMKDDLVKEVSLVSDVIGLRILGVEREPVTHEEDWSMTFPPPLGMPSFVKGTLAWKGKTEDQLLKLMNMLKINGIYPMRWVVSYGTGSVPPAWRVEYNYIARKP